MESLKYNGTDVRFKNLENLAKDTQDLARITRKKLMKETCPVFCSFSIKPKLKFNENKIFGENEILSLPRNLISIFGFPSYGVHCNGWSKKKDTYIIHMAIRSKKINEFPGLYDNLFAGGQPSNISIKNNLKKEALEEAGIALNFKNLTKGSIVPYCHSFRRRIHSGIIFNYHLEFKNKPLLTNLDGEVDKFVSVDVKKIYQLIELKKLKPNCIIPIADFFLNRISDFFPEKGILELRKVLFTNI